MISKKMTSNIMSTFLWPGNLVPFKLSLFWVILMLCQNPGSKRFFSSMNLHTLTRSGEFCYYQVRHILRSRNWDDFFKDLKLKDFFIVTKRQTIQKSFFSGFDIISIKVLHFSNIFFSSFSLCLSLLVPMVYVGICTSCAGGFFTTPPPLRQN